MRCKVGLLILFIIALNACSPKRAIKSVPTQPIESIKKSEKEIYQTGIASWYGEKFHGRRTANGEIYNMYKLTAAHKTLPFHTLLMVQNLNNKKEVFVRINDRGPFVKGRIIDLSYKAACGIGLDIEGTGPVALKIIRASYLGKQETTVNNEEKKPSFEEPDAEKKAQTTNTFYVQAGAFTEQLNAKKMLANIKLIFSEISFNIIFQNDLYKVISDPMNSREKAEEVKRILIEIDIDAFIREEWSP